ncbi:ring-opening amidohydrolase [Salinisphaera sp. C84B14]|uniref:cyanuric acid amidohydrolase n=1 Tax=Salinisphaera sp. C84B14 TaxID=1304155 RepID=UPI003342B8C9
MSASYTTAVHRIATAGPADTRGLERMIDKAEIDPQRIVAIFGKTEGNGCVNDFTRGYATQSLRQLLAGHIGAAANEIAMVMSGGTEGVLTPHITVITRTPSASPPAADGAKALAVGIARTPTIAPAALGRMAQVDAVAAAVNDARRQAGIEASSDVHYVQIKCPLLTSARIAKAEAAGGVPVTTDTYKSMGYSRGASALGAALALGEIEADTLADDHVLKAMDRFSRVASASAGSELNYCEVIVFGNSATATGDLYAAHGVMNDAIDARAVGLAIGGENADHRLVQVFAKAEADPSGQVRGRRHTMIDDSDINHTRHARAVVGGVIASIAGDPMIYVSGGAEHQGPAGGGVVAAILSR